MKDPDTRYRRGGKVENVVLRWSIPTSPHKNSLIVHYRRSNRKMIATVTTGRHSGWGGSEEVLNRRGTGKLPPDPLRG